MAALSDDLREDAVTKALSETSCALWREAGDRRGLASALHRLGWAEAGAGRSAVAVARFQDALSHARAIGDNQMVAHILSSLGNLKVELGEFGAALPFLRESLSIARAAYVRSEMAEIPVDLGWLALDLGDTGAARAHFAEGLQLLGKTHRRRHLVYAIEGCAVLASMSGQRNLAIALVTSAEAARGEMGVPSSRDPRLVVRLSSAREAYAQLTAEPVTGECWSLDEAVRQAETFTAAPIATEDVAPSHSLTARELDVLYLLVAGGTDRSIAGSLFISRRTASKHVAAIIAKFGVASRTEVAAQAVRDGLA